MIHAIWLVACGGEGGPTSAGLVAQDFAGPESFRMEFVEGPIDTGETPDGEVLHLHAEDGTWSFRLGQRWSEATPMGEHAIEVDGGLTIDGEVVLPERVSPGASEGGAEVTALGELQVWYGTFPTAASVTVSEGFEGDHAFAQHIGPIQLQLFDASWELAFYEVAD